MHMYFIISPFSFLVGFVDCFKYEMDVEEESFNLLSWSPRVVSLGMLETSCRLMELQSSNPIKTSNDPKIHQVSNQKACPMSLVIGCGLMDCTSLIMGVPPSNKCMEVVALTSTIFYHKNHININIWRSGQASLYPFRGS